MATYYVDGVGGNDTTGTGATGTPWKTLAKAYNSSAAGDTIKVRSATYTQTLNLAKANQIWEADTGATPIIDGGYGQAQQGQPPTGYLPGAEFASMVMLNANGVRFTGFTLRNIGGVPIRIADNNCTVSYCSIDWSYGGGIVINSDAGTVTGVWVHHNTMMHLNQKKYDSSRGSIADTPAGVQSTLVFHTCVAPICEYNTVKYSHGEGIVFGRGTTDGIMRYNTVINVAHVALYINRALRTQMYGNVAWHDGTGPYVSQRDSKPPEGIVYGDESGRVVRNFSRSAGAIITNNLIVGYESGFQVRCSGENYGGSSMSNVYLAHNTFVNNWKWGIDVRNPTSAAHTTTIIENNVIHQASGLGAVSFGVSSLSGVSVRRNAWSALPAAALRATGDVVGNLHLANPNAAFTADTFNIDNYRPTSDSPFMNVAQYGGAYGGFTPPAMTTDLDGDTRDQSAPDMGAFDGTGGGGGGGGTPGEGIEVVGKRYAIGTAAAQTTGSPTTQTITWGTELETAPTAVILIASKGITNNTAADGLILGMGFWAGTGQGSISTNSEHGNTTSNTYRDVSNAAALVILDPASSTRDGEATVNSVSTSGVVLNWANYPTAAYKIIAIGLVGEQAQVNVVALPETTNGTAAVTPGFEPDLVFGLTNQRTTAGWQAKFSFGVVHNGSSVTQRGVAWESRKDQADTLVRNRFLTNAMLGYMHSSISWRISLGSFDTTGFVATALDSGATGYGIFLSVQLTDVGVSLATANTATTTGDATTTGVGFEPGFLFEVGTMLASVDTDSSTADAGTIAFGVTDGTTSASISVSEDVSAAVTNNQSLFSTKFLEVPADDGAAGYAMTITSLDADGYTEFYTAANGTARKRIVLALEAVEEEGGDPDPGPITADKWIEEIEEMLIQSIAARVAFTLVSTTDGATPVTGATPTVTLSKNGGAFAAASGTPTETGDGLYYIDLTTTETNTVGPLALRITATGAVPRTRQFRVIASIPSTHTATEWNVGADHVLRRSSASAEASSSGDAVGFRSLLGVIAKLTNKVAASGGTLNVYKADDTTVLGTQTLSTNESAAPIVTVDTV